MPVTDLTGTTWVFNNGLKSPSADFLYALQFISNNITYAKIQTNGFSGPAPVRDLRYNDTNVYVYNSKGWINEAYKTISITGGADATNTNLINWLEANATKQESTPKVSVDLTTLSGWANLSTGNHTIKIKAKGTGYIDSELSAGVTVSKAPSTVTLEKGTYKWKDTTSIPNTNIAQSFDFTSKPYNSNIDFEKVTIETSGYIRYSTKKSSLDSFYRRPDGKWVTQNAEGDETITIGLQTITLSTDQTVSAEFYKWAITDGNLVKQVEPAAYTDCLTFTGETSEFTLKATNKTWDGTLEWSTDHNTWTTLTGTEAMQSVDKKLYLRGKGNTKFYTTQGVRWQLSAKAGCSGNIQTLLDWENPPTSISATYCYSYMFRSCESLTTAPELPATTLAEYCYFYMFSGCTSLTSAPALPATTLAAYCYSYMFNGCTSLTTTPSLPATTLAAYCYSYMFKGCTSLTTTPSLPATTLAEDCYSYMFSGCTSLTTPPELPATTLSGYCYSRMFNGCKSLTSAPALPATTLAAYCYSYMFNGCTSLTASPELPATVLQPYCYAYMFRGCTGLKISTTQSSEYPTAWRIPSSGTISSTATNWNTSMLSNTGGTFTSDPSINTTYYGAW